MSQSLNIEVDDSDQIAEQTVINIDGDASEDEKEAEMYKTYMKKKRQIN